MQTKDKYWWERYSLYRSGWHRFWFAMFVSVCVVLGILGNRPSEKERAETFQYLEKVKAELCEKSCSPKSGYITNEPVNPLTKPPNNVGRDGPRTRCNCS
jgi:Cytochrome b(C-terminal)/b6/petD